MLLTSKCYNNNICTQAVLCRRDTSTGKSLSIPLTTDHNPTLYAERKRIQKCGGRVMLVLVLGFKTLTLSPSQTPTTITCTFYSAIRPFPIQY